MSAKLYQTSLIIAAAALIFSASAPFAKNMYRWVDDDGNTYFSDQIPPEHIEHRREKISENGRIISITEKAKSPEQQALDNRLEKLRNAQKKIIKKQKSYDRVLLATYRSLDDLLAGVERKNQTIAVQIKASKGNVNRLAQQLESQQKEAAVFERNAKKIPQKLLDDIQSTKLQIQEAQQALDQQIAKQNAIKNDDNIDIERYLFLTQANDDSAHQLSKVASIKEANALGLFYCQNDHQCNKAWQIGRKFVNFYSTTAADIDNDTLIMTMLPTKDSDLSLSLSKIELNDGEYQLFLDIRCLDSISGRELCVSEKVHAIRTSFGPYINDALTRSAQ
ncbi:MAG: hypothetical protein CVV13_07165 [Gammaproteobacteria bacterium HGW-Gammaproteobacteria-3]|nr:MAG: hypothetical protein CVV13_07165 [Gammaproteobacteria bacterium HGW-Gammaproteobacteria-3]